jgi:RNA polymerase sigma-70 factor (ECF subfamily)
MASTRYSDPEHRRAEFEATALPWLGALHRLASRLTHHGPDAADLVQETFLRAYRTFDNFEPGTNGRAWLFTIMYSIFINQQRQLARRGQNVPVEDIDQVDTGDAFGFSDASERATEVEVSGVRVGPEVEEALRSLPEEFRAVVLLVDGHDMTYDEAAEVLSCPVGTVRSRLFRSRRLLANKLREYAARGGFTGGAQ